MSKLRRVIPIRLTMESMPWSSKSSKGRKSEERMKLIRRTFRHHNPPIFVADYIGTGGFADVFKATSGYGDTTDFAIKILVDDLLKPRSGKEFDRQTEEMRIKDIKKRFTNESYVQWSLSQHMSERVSQSVVRVFDHGEFDTRTRFRFILMERMASTLRDFINDRANFNTSPNMLAYKTMLLAKIADLIFSVHQEGIFHRDIKPENIFFCNREAKTEPLPAASGRRRYEREILVKLGDFGTVRWVHTYTDKHDGVIIGSQWYLSPEQIFNPERLDTRTDIYSFGVVAYEVMYGAHPKNVNPNTRNILEKLAWAKPTPRTPAKGFEPLHDIIYKCMEDVNARYQTMAEVVRDLRQFLTAIV
jgi:serine/threonine protein kinase